MTNIYLHPEFIVVHSKKWFCTKGILLAFALLRHLQLSQRPEVKALFPLAKFPFRSVLLVAAMEGNILMTILLTTAWTEDTKCRFYGVQPKEFLTQFFKY